MVAKLGGGLKALARAFSRAAAAPSARFSDFMIPSSSSQMRTSLE